MLCKGARPDFGREVILADWQALKRISRTLGARKATPGSPARTGAGVSESVFEQQLTAGLGIIGIVTVEDHDVVAADAGSLDQRIVGGAPFLVHTTRNSRGGELSILFEQKKWGNKWGIPRLFPVFFRLRQTVVRAAPGPDRFQAALLG